MLVILGLTVAVIVPLATVITALLAAPEAYEGEHGLCIIREARPSNDCVVLLTKAAPSFFSSPEPTGLEPATSAVTGRRSSQLS
jgi:hypothetical protein